MRKSRLAIVAVAVGLSLFAAACGDDSGSSSATTAGGGAATTGGGGAATTGAGGAKAAKVGVILPDTKSSVRWETADRPFLEDAFKAAGLDYDIQNAEGDKTKMATIADQMITSGVTVLMIVNLDSESGAAIEKKAADAGVKTIDYDRLTLGGSAAVYVSFDNVKVGELQGQGLVDCLTAKGTATPAVAVLNGSPTDNNATLFAQGYNSILKPKFDSGDYKLVDDQSVPDWDNQQGRPDLRADAHEGWRQDRRRARSQRRPRRCGDRSPAEEQPAGPGHRSGRDGRRVRFILTGDQCMTVYKAVKTEADAAAKAAIALANGQTPETTGTVTDTQTNKEVPSVLPTPVAITIKNVKAFRSTTASSRRMTCARASSRSVLRQASSDIG